MARPKKNYSEVEIEGLIKRYLKENPDSYQIKPNTFSNYVISLYENNIINTNFKSSFWRSQSQLGRKIIDKWNGILLNSQKDESEILGTVYNTDALVKALKIKVSSGFVTKMKYNEAQAKKYLKKFEECEELKSEINELKSKLSSFKLDIEVLQKLTFNLTINEVVSNELKINNLNDIAKNSNAPLNHILKKCFSELSDDTFNTWIKGDFEFSYEDRNEKVIQINEYSRSAFNDFEF